MGEQEQLIYMQTRLMRMAMERLNMTPAEVSVLFERYGLAEFIEENFDLYHTEGDEAVYADLMTILKKKGGFFHD